MTALEPPVVLTASGFGIGRFNGTLTSVGTINGQPVYSPNTSDTTVFYLESGGARWVAGYVSAPGAMDMPDPNPNPMYELAGATPIGPWAVVNGDAPAGTIQ